MRAILALVAVTLAGCLSASDGAVDSAATEPKVITDPTDFSDMEGGAGGHLHDYWGGKTQLTILDETRETGATWFGDPFPVASFWPADGVTIPQGAAFVDVTFDWTDETTDAYSPPELFLKTQADSEAVLVAKVEKGVPIRVASTNEMNDLPHQTVSAWNFQFVVGRPDNVRPLRITTPVAIRVEATRGLEIPLYPAHPDRWGGSNELKLVEHGQTSLYWGDTASGEWSCFDGCPIIYAPESGIIVPYDAARVRVEIGLDGESPTRLGLKYHGADTRSFVAAKPTEDSSTKRVYEIPVSTKTTDGPYAKQSLWQFVPYVEAPRENAAYSGTYTIAATVHRS